MMSERTMQASLLRQEGLRVYAGLLENGAQRSLGHVARVVRDGGLTVQPGIEPNLMLAGCLAVELQAELLRTPDDVPIAKARQRTHQVATISG